jgi:hypothetical protein
MIDYSTLIAILTNLFSGFIGAIIVFILVSWNENQKRVEKQKLVATAFLMEIDKYQRFFQIILPYYQTLVEFGYSSPPGFGDTTSYQELLFNAIVDYPAIASTGNNSGILKNSSPFIEFHKEIFEFNDEKVVAELDQYCDHIFIADKFFKNYCDVNTRNENDIWKFIVNIRRANDLMQGGKIIAYLEEFKGNKIKISSNTSSFMKNQWNIIGAIVLLIIAIVGILYVEWGSFFSSDINVKLLANSILYLALLSIALFYINNKAKLIVFTHAPWVGNLGGILLIGFIVGFIGIEGISLTAGNGIYLVPIFMASLAFGLFYAGQALNRA